MAYEVHSLASRSFPKLDVADSSLVARRGPSRLMGITLCVWMVNRLQIIGEAARKLSDDFRRRHPEMPWREIIGMRHILVHGYFEIDPDIVWTAITESVPRLKSQVETVLATDRGVRPPGT